VKRVQCRDLVWQNLVQSVAVAAQCNSAVGCHVVYVYVLVDVDNKFALWMNLIHNTRNNKMKLVTNHCAKQHFICFNVPGRLASHLAPTSLAPVKSRMDTLWYQFTWVVLENNN